MRGMWTGLGLVFGTAAGLLLMVTVLDGDRWVPLAAGALGLVAGAVADMRDGRPPGDGGA